MPDPQSSSFFNRPRSDSGKNQTSGIPAGIKNARQRFHTFDFSPCLNVAEVSCNARGVGNIVQVEVAD